MKALLIPVEGPVEEVTLDGTLEQLQGLVGGWIEAVPLPEFIDGADEATSYINEEGKFTCEPNMRATDFFVPGIGIRSDDYIAGPCLICGFDLDTGDQAKLPETVAARVRLIEQEAG